MKILLLPFFFLMSCSSHRNTVIGPKPSFTITSETTSEQVEADKGTSKGCRDIERFKYCQWGQETLVFVDNKYIKTIPYEKDALSYDVTYSSIKDDENVGKNIIFEVGNKKLNSKSIEWRRYLKFFRYALTTNGFVLVNSAKEAEAVVKVDFGVKTMSSGKARRHLNFVSVDKSDTEQWKIEMTSLGKSLDLNRLIPVLSALTQSMISQNSESVQKFTINENNLEVVSFKDFVSTQK